MKELTGTRQWSDASENNMIGCSNNCRYCYGKKNFVRFKRGKAEDWPDEHANPRRLHPRKHHGVVMYPTTHDLHMKNQNIWFPYLEELLELGNDVLIVSKPEYRSIRLIADNLERFKDHIEFRFTIGSCNDYVLKFWEPNAPSFAERMMALDYTHVSGFKNSVSMEPLLDLDPTLLIDLVKPFTNGTIWIGTMNHMRKSDFASNEMKMYERMMEINSEKNIRRIYEQFKGYPFIRWKDSIVKMLGLDHE